MVSVGSVFSSVMVLVSACSGQRLVPLFGHSLDVNVSLLSSTLTAMKMEQTEKKEGEEEEKKDAKLMER